ncbi:MAG: hypothetical protein R8P61_05535 [Bacteroidia bacterium]|nr:hypothetical protein [Bacteroidia bacterium]
MAKKFTRKKLRLRARAQARRHNLKVAPTAKGVKETLEQKNMPVIASLEAKVKAAQS